MPPLDERAAVRRLYDRFGWGARRSDVDGGVARGFDASVDVLLGATGDDPGAAATPPPSVDVGDDPGADDPRKEAYEQKLAERRRALMIWWLDRMSAVQKPARERATWFWHGHFATSEEKVRRPALMLRQNETQRGKALGGFGELTRAMLADPAMILWLDGHINRVRLPNENLGRELLELFALGVGHYTEDDVKEAARALTGWTVDREEKTATFKRDKHDTGVKTVLGRRDDFDTNGLADLVVGTDQSARFVAGRVWRRYVSDTPPPEPELERLVGALGAKRDLTALLRATATSTTFQDRESSLVKQPVEWAVGLARAAGVRVTAPDDDDRKDLLDRLTKLGQVPFRPPNVGGWPAGSAWLTPTATVRRVDIATLLLAKASLDGVPSGTNARLEWARARLGVDAWSPRTRDALAGAAADGPTALLTAAAASPEYVVSG